MKIVRSTVLWSVVSSIVLVVAGTIALLTIRRLVKAQGLVTHAEAVVDRLRSIQQITTEAESGQRGYVITGLEQYLEPYHDARFRAVELEGEVRALTSDDPAQQRRLDRLDELTIQWFGQLKDVLDLRRAAGLDAAARHILAARSTDVMAQLSQVMADMLEEEQRELMMRTREVRQLVATATAVIIGAVGACMLWMALGRYLFIRAVTTPLDLIARTARSYGEGDLSRRLPLPRADELRRIAVAFNSMAEHRQQAETSLRVARATIEKLIAASPLPIIGVAPDATVLVWNQAAERMFGWTAEEARGHSLRTISTETEGCERILPRVLEGHSVVGLETVRRRKDGVDVEVSLSAAPMQLDDTTRGCMAVFEDISARKEVERERERNLETARRLSWVLEALAQASVVIADETVSHATGPIALLQVIVDQARVIVNAEYGALGVGTDPNCAFDPWVHSGSAAIAAESLGSLARPRGLFGWVARHGQVTCIDDIHKHPVFQEIPGQFPAFDALLAVPIRYEGQTLGSLFLARMPGRPSFSPQDQHAIELLAAYAGVAIENRRLHEALLAERGRLRLLAESAASSARTLNFAETVEGVVRVPVPLLADACILYLLDPQRRMTPVAAACVDPTVAEGLQEGSFEVPPGGSPESPVATVLQSGRPQLIRDLPSAPAEMPAWLRTTPHLARLAPRSAMVVRVGHGNSAAGVLVFLSRTAGRYDASDLELAEELARRAWLSIENVRHYEAAQRAIQVREDVLAIVSHDLRSPLSVIRANAELLARTFAAGPRDEKLTGKVEAIRRSAQRMSRMVADLLDAAAIDAGRLSVTPERQAVRPILDEVQESLQSAAREKGIDLEVALSGAVPDVACDRARINQLLMNLVVNAIKFTPEPGTITLCAEVDGPEVRFSVTDTGPGIVEADIPHLFQRYWRVEKTRAPGSGLGLYIARGIVEAHGGHIGVKSEPGRGTTFWFSLPIWRPAA